MPVLPVLLFLIFMVLRLTEVITWSWWWVTSPLWIAGIVTVLFLAFIKRIVSKRKATVQNWLNDFK